MRGRRVPAVTLRRAPRARRVLSSASAPAAAGLACREEQKGPGLST